MANDLPIRGPVGPEKSSPARGAVQSGTSADATSHARFRELLDALEVKAKALEERSRTVEAPADLHGAVEGARASLEDLLSIRDRLIEAYRESELERRTPPGASAP